MKERIYLIVKNPFKESDIKRFNVEELEKYFDLTILDCSEWLLPNSIKTRGSATIKLSNLYKISNSQDLKKVVSKQGGYALDFIGLFSLNAIRLFNIIIKRGVKVVVVDSGPFPSPGPTKSSHSLIQKFLVIINNGLIQRFIYARLLKLYLLFAVDMRPEIALVSGTSWLNNPRFSNAKKIIPAHSFDYETYMNINSYKIIEDQSYALYLDENIAFHEDNSEMKLNTPVFGIEFLYQLELFFQEVEKTTGLPVKIAAYPSTNKEVYSKVFGNREITYENTASMIKNSKMVFAHASTAISFAVLWRKPIYFLIDDYLKNSWYYADVESARDIIRGKQIDINNLGIIEGEFKDWETIDQSAYENYESTYIKSKESSEKSLWSILSIGIYAGLSVA